jgi:hypothetical protein
MLLLVIALSTFVLTGCPNEPSKNLSNKNATAEQISNRVNKYLAARQGSYYAALSADTKKAQRDDTIEDVLAMIDSNYQDYINRLQMRRSTFDFVADVIDLGTGAATGIAKGERPNQILGIALTAFRGGRKSLELNFYKEQTVPILITKMDGNRAKVYAEILQKKAKPVEQYSLSESIRDMVAYYNAGTLVRAFTELSKDTSAQTQQSEKRVLQLKGINPSDFVNVSPEALKTDLDVDQSLRALLSTLSSGSDTEKKTATGQLRDIYLDLVNGANKADFKPFIEKVKSDNAALKAEMDKLEGSDATKRDSVSGDDIAEIIAQIRSRIDPEKQAPLMTKMQASFAKVLKK